MAMDKATNHPTTGSSSHSQKRIMSASPTRREYAMTIGKAAPMIIKTASSSMSSMPKV